MKTMTRMNAFALLAVAAVALGVAGSDAGLERQRSIASIAVTEVPAASFTAKIATDWLEPTAARRQIEVHTAVLERLAAEHDVAVRVVRSEAQMRTRSAEGSRLQAPLARFERFFVIRTHDLDALSVVLAGQVIELAPVVDPGANFAAGDTGSARSASTHF